MVDSKLGENLKKAREKTGLTQNQVAQKAGIHVNYYARIERAEVDASLDTLKTIAQILHVKVSEIIPF